jgi:putative transcriptional regulator
MSSGLRLRPLRSAAHALCAFLLLFGASWPTSADDPKPLTAMVLVARAELPDPNFKDSIVLVMNNLGSGPAGVIINRPTKVTVSHLFPELEKLVHLQDKVYFGGPVEFGSVWFVFSADAPREKAIQAFDGVYVSTSRELLLELLNRDKPMAGLRIFVGHSGWAPGQLQAEIARGDWTLEAAQKDAIFNRKSEHPWPEQQTPDAPHGS